MSARAVGTVCGWTVLLIGGAVLYSKYARSMCQHNISEHGAVVRALHQYRQEHGRYPDKLDALLPQHFKAVPRCPAAWKGNYGAGYQAWTSSRPTNYYLTCPHYHREGTQCDARRSQVNASILTYQAAHAGALPESLSASVPFAQDRTCPADGQEYRYEPYPSSCFTLVCTGTHDGGGYPQYASLQHQ